MSLWQQNYDPAGNIWLSSLIASLPILFFFFALIKLKLKGYLAATYTVAIPPRPRGYNTSHRPSRAPAAGSCDTGSGFTGGLATKSGLYTLAHTSGRCKPGTVGGEASVGGCR